MRKPGTLRKIQFGIIQLGKMQFGKYSLEKYSLEKIRFGKIHFEKMQFVSSPNINNNTKLSPRYSSFSFMEIQKAIEERNPLPPRNKSKIILLAQIQM